MKPTVVINIPEVVYLKLKVILDEERGNSFDLEDVREIANKLVELYLLLSKNPGYFIKTLEPVLIPLFLLDV